MEPKPLKDNNATINKAYKLLPPSLYNDFLKAIAELEDNNTHKSHSFPHTQLHKVQGTKTTVYRAYIDKTSGYRLHVQYGTDHFLELNDILTGDEHDNAAKVIKSRKTKYR